MYDENSIIEEKKSKTGKIGGKIIRILGYLLFATLVLIIVIRSLMMKPDSEMKLFLWNDKSIEAYNTYGDDFKVFTLYEYNSNNTENIFNISNIRYIENISQFQFTLRWNNQTIQRLMQYDGISMPEDENELFVFAVADDKGKIYSTYEYTSDSKYQYSFRRIIFDGIDLTDVKSLSVIAFTTYEKADISLSDACDEIPLYVSTDAGAKYRIKPSEMFKNNTPSSGLTKMSVTFTDKTSSD